MRVLTRVSASGFGQATFIMTFPSSSAPPPDAYALLRPHKGLLIALGLLTLLGGTAAILWPALASVAVTAVVGAALMVQGAVQFWDALNVPGWRPRLWHFVTGLIALIGGALLVWNPLEGVLTLTALLIVMILLGGGARVAMALAARPQKGWGWLLLSGLISLGLGAYLMSLYFSTPEALTAEALTQEGGEAAAAARVLGLFSLLGLMVGISMIFEGWSYLLLALALPKAPPETDLDEDFAPAPRTPPAAPLAPLAPPPAPAPAAATPEPEPARPTPARSEPARPDPVRPLAAEPPPAAAPASSSVAATPPAKPLPPPQNRPARAPENFAAPAPTAAKTPPEPPAKG